jgi:ABC-2 type transport system ATP-binding protein
MKKPAPSDTSPGHTVVELKDVNKTFYQRQRSEKVKDVFKNLFRPNIREIQALKNVDLEISRGEIVAYAGPNGAGKSTTVKLLSSVLAPTSGTVRVFGLDPMRDRIEYVRRIGVVFGQRTELWWDQPVAASFEWKRVVWDIPRNRYQKSLAFVKELLGLDDFFNTLCRQLSLGQKMRADLGLMLLHEPEILFLDEPTIGVDVLAKRNIMEFIKDLNAERNVTVILTSHDMTELEQLAGRIVLIDQGRIAFDGNFAKLRKEFGDRRHLCIETSDITPPEIEDAEWLRTEGHHHHYIFDASRIHIPDLLDRAATQSAVLDVETHRTSIDDVIADIYQKWQDTQST